MNIRESNEMNTLLHWVLDGADPDASDAGKAKAAAEFLSGRSYKALIAGIRPDDVTAAWPAPTSALESTSAPEVANTHGA